MHPQPKCFHDAQSTSVKQFDDELRRSIQKRDEPGHFFAGHNDGNIYFPPRENGVDHTCQGLFQDLFIKEDQCIHDLVLCRRSNMSFQDKVSEKRLDLPFTALEVFP